MEYLSRESEFLLDFVDGVCRGLSGGGSGDVLQTSVLEQCGYGFGAGFKVNHCDGCAGWDAKYPSQWGSLGYVQGLKGCGQGEKVYWSGVEDSRLDNGLVHVEKIGRAETHSAVTDGLDHVKA